MKVEYVSSDSLYFNNFIRLYEVVKQIESSGNPSAIRFEGNYVSRISHTDKAYLRAKEYLHAFPHTIKAYLSFSVGRLQFMTYNLYFMDALYEYLRANNLLPVPIPFITDEKHEMALFHLFLKERLLGFYLKLKAGAVELKDFRTFGRFWNGEERYGEKAYQIYQRHKGV